MDDVISALRREAEAVMSATPGVTYEWKSTEKTLALRIPAMSTEGFDVELEASRDGLQLRCGSMHVPLEDGSDVIASIRNSLALVRDLLSPTMRLRELCAGGSPHRWFLEADSKGDWLVEHEMGLLLWNFLGRRSERIYRNTHLPPRGLVGDVEPQAAVEIHDSTLERIESIDDDVVVTIDAYVHRSAGRPGVDAGTGWSQPAQFRLVRGRITDSVGTIPLELLDGRLVLSGETHSNIIPMPLSHVGPSRIEFESWNESRIVIEGDGVTAVFSGPPVYVEDFAP